MLQNILNFLLRLGINLLVIFMNVIYGYKNYRRFYVLETVARIPYFAYLSVLHFYQSIGRHPSIELMELHFKESQNEEYHLMIMEEMGGGKHWYDRVISRILGLFYYWFVVVLFVISPKSAYYLMEMIEEFAVKSYQQFIDEHRGELRLIKPGPIASNYFNSNKARMTPRPQIPEFSMLDVLESIKFDEMVHVTDMKVCEELDNFSDYKVDSDGSVKVLKAESNLV